ncbi:histidine phosphatase family protein [Metabacillus sp. HB246100]
MEISFIRHGRSTWTNQHKITASELRTWILQYDQSGIITEAPVPVASKTKAIKASLLVTSDLLRSISSATHLSGRSPDVADGLFREVEIPAPPTLFNRIRLRPGTWLILMRIAWLFGYSNHCESKVAATKRAIAAAELLVEFAEEHQSITLIGHGIFNKLSAKELLKRGWQNEKKHSTKHWACVSYVRRSE